MSFTAAYVVAAACLGYVFCLKCYKFRYSLARKSGYYSYLYCTSFGIIFLLTGSVIGIKVFGVDALRPIELVGTGGSLKVLAANVLAGSIVAFCSVVFFNTVTEKKTAIALAWVDDLSVMLNKAIALELPVQVSLDNRKVYIGFVFDTLEPDEESSYLSILPVMSGYRDKNTLDLVITQKYEKIIDLLNINEHGQST